jgi:hypothetical protein
MFLQRCVVFSHNNLVFFFYKNMSGLGRVYWKIQKLIFKCFLIYFWRTVFFTHWLPQQLFQQIRLKNTRNDWSGQKGTPLYFCFNFKLCFKQKIINICAFPIFKFFWWCLFSIVQSDYIFRLFKNSFMVAQLTAFKRSIFRCVQQRCNEFQVKIKVFTLWKLFNTWFCFCFYYN